MARHKEKDDEAGGEGLGVLATRKRLWRDANGNIVNTRRPSYPPDASKARPSCRVEKKTKTSERKTRSPTTSLPSPTISTSRKTSSSTTSSSVAAPSPTTIVVDTGASNFEYPDPEAKLEPDSWLDMALPSPPITEPSLQSSTAASPAADLSDLDALYDDSAWPLDDGLPPPSSMLPQHAPYLSPPATDSWPQPQPFQTFMGAMAQLPYDDIFKPEAALYDWQLWNSQVLMSRCREEKRDVGDERRWTTPRPRRRASGGRSAWARADEDRGGC
jgi:hypothetical protein